MDTGDVHGETTGKVLPGSLLGPIVGLTFSTDGALLFTCSGSSLWVFEVRSGALLSTVRAFTPGVAVFGMDIHAACEFGTVLKVCTSVAFVVRCFLCLSRLWLSGLFLATSTRKPRLYRLATLDQHREM